MQVKCWGLLLMINLELDTKYIIDYTSKFKKQLKKMIKQGKDIDLFL